MNNPKDYKAIRAWGWMLGSYEYYIKDQQQMAANDNAPLNAIYKRDRWYTVDDITNPETKKLIKSAITRINN